MNTGHSGDRIWKDFLDIKYLHIDFLKFIKYSKEPPAIKKTLSFSLSPDVEIICMFPENGVIMWCGN